jgi:hypothetical protein
MLNLTTLPQSFYIEGLEDADFTGGIEEGQAVTLNPNSRGA